MSFADKYSLNIPYVLAADERQHFENYKEIQRWATRLPVSEGGKIPFLVAASDAPDAVRDAASYVCTGTNDHTVINQAIADTYASDWGNGRVVLSEGNFSLGGDLDYVTSLVGAGGGSGGAFATIVEMDAASSGPVVNANHIEGIDFIAEAAVGTFILANQGTVHASSVSTSVLGGSITTGLSCGDFVQVSSFGAIDCTTGIDLSDSAGNFMLSDVVIQDCDTGLDVDGPGVAIASCQIVDVPASGTGIQLTTGTLVVGGCNLTAASASGTTGINRSGGTLNVGTEANCSFDGFGTNISGGTGGSTAGVVAESDSDGQRIPIRDENGAIQGYVGWSAAVGGVAVWVGDSDDVTTFSAPALWMANGYVYLQTANADGQMGVDANGAVYLNGSSSGGILMETNSLTRIDTGTLRFFGIGTGIDGTDTPTTAAELADVLVDLGIIASHTIT